MRQRETADFGGREYISSSTTRPFSQRSAVMKRTWVAKDKITFPESDKIIRLAALTLPLALKNQTLTRKPMYKRPTLIYNICMFNIFKNHRLLQAIWTSLFKLILQPRKTMKPRILKMGDGSWGIRKLPGIQKMRTRGARTPEKKKVEVSVTVCLQLSL